MRKVYENRGKNRILVAENRIIDMLMTEKEAKKKNTPISRGVFD
jgi:hypothetical protein